MQCRVYIAYDKGDKFFDNAVNLRKIDAWCVQSIEPTSPYLQDPTVSQHGRVENNNNNNNNNKTVHLSIGLRIMSLKRLMVLL